MILTLGGTSKTIDISAYKPNFENGIVWECVGGVWQGIDRGAETDHYSTTVTIDGLYSEVQEFRDFVLLALRSGSDVSVACGEAEKIFGCEFDYSAPFACAIFSSEEVFSSQAPDGRVLGQWNFSVFPAFDLSTRFLSLSDSWPALVPSRIERRGGVFANTEQKEVRNARTAFYNDEPTCTVTYSGNALTIAQAKQYLAARRLASFVLTSPADIFYFTNGAVSQSVYFSGLVDSGNIDQHSARAEISVTYLLAR